ncbi:MAG: VOC family protein [Rheinheimera sp.]|nr:VOC family protein [Rheinheimera sp.]
MTASSISALKQLAYVVSDVPRAVAFFQQLGLPLLFQPSAQLAFIAVGSVRLMLTQPQGAGIVGQNSVLYLQCQQIEAEYQRLLAADIVSEQSPHCVAQMGDYDLWLAFFRDPDGNLLALLEEKLTKR